MLITPRPGADRKNIRQALSGVHTTAMNLQRPYGSAFEGLLAYLEWATESALHVFAALAQRGCRAYGSAHSPHRCAPDPVLPVAGRRWLCRLFTGR